MSLSQYFTLGSSGLRVSRLGLGTATFGTDWGWGADKETARRMFQLYMEAGGNLIDTADFYTNGVSEQWVGEFVRERALRDKAVIVTKFSFNGDPTNPNSGGNGRKSTLLAVERSLKRLGTDYIDLYLLHAWDQLTPVEEVMRTFEELVRSGRVRYVGFSNVPAWYASRAQSLAQLHGHEPIAALQLEYSLVERSIESEFIPLATRYGMGTMAWSPLGSGLLSGKYKPSQEGEIREGRLYTVSGSGNPAFDKFSERNFRIVAELESVAVEMGRSMAQVALNWAAHRPGVATVLVGATNPGQLQENLQALDFEMPQELTARLDHVSARKPASPYYYFAPEMQTLIAGSHPVGDKPAGYAPKTYVTGKAPAVAGEVVRR